MDKSGDNFSYYVGANILIVNLNMMKAKGGSRGKVKGMSKKSSSALIKFLNSVCFDKAAFITLTYRYNQQDPKRAYADLRALYKRLCYKYDPCCVVWKAELQERGAIHYHLFALDAPDGWKEGAITDEWLEVTKQEGDTAARRYGVQTKCFDTIHQKDSAVVITYLAKYTAKAGAAPGGKAWGIFGRKIARETRETGKLEATGALSAADYLVSLGAQAYEITPCGVQYRLYLGHVGTKGGGDGDSRIDTFLDYAREVN